MKWLIFLPVPLMMLGCSQIPSGRQFSPASDRSQYRLENEMDWDETRELNRNEEYGDIL